VLSLEDAHSRLRKWQHRMMCGAIQVIPNLLAHLNPMPYPRTNPPSMGITAPVT
jgi:hypothetical protein